MRCWCDKLAKNFFQGFKRKPDKSGGISASVCDVQRIIIFLLIFKMTILSANMKISICLKSGSAKIATFRHSRLQTRRVWRMADYKSIPCLL